MCSAAGARVQFPEGEEAKDFEGKIVECAWDGEKGVWTFMRIRSDKLTPNAYHVYEKVMQVCIVPLGGTLSTLFLALDHQSPTHTNTLLLAPPAKCVNVWFEVLGGGLCLGRSDCSTNLCPPCV